jgi:hypothetical protein
MGDEIPLNMVCAMKVSGYDTEPFTRKEKAAVKDFLKSDEACLFEFV